MKANELMIGDWVCLADGNLLLEERYFKIEYLATSAGVSWVNQGTNAPIGLRDGESLIPVFTDEIYPIPLTTEILEKNGFIRINADVTTYKLTKYLYWTPRGLEHELSEIPICPLNYVHELQHALKLCGIDKEIVV